MSEDGRVLRFDSLSKVLSSGLRIGWCTGPAPLIERMVLHMQASQLHASGISQMFAAALLQTWGWEGFEEHIYSVQKFYKNKKDIFLKLVEKHLTGYATWITPKGGMFVWMKLLNVKDSKELIETKARDKKVLLVPGQAFHPLDQPGPYVRASFSSESEENMDM